MLALEWNMDDALQARFEEGRNEGREEGRETVAVNLINMGMAFDKIQEATKLSLERIKELAKKNF